MGIPTGMTEQVVIVYDVDEGLDKFYSRMIEARKDLSIAEWPLVEGRTHAVFVPWRWQRIQSYESIMEMILMWVR